MSRLFRQLLAIPLVLGVAVGSVRAQESGHQALSEFSNALYVLGELTGGSPDEWDEAEAALLAVLDDLAQQGLLDPAVTDKAGLTLLARAVASGYGVAVARLLERPGAAEALEMPDKNGLTPYHHAEIAIRQTLRSCHPVIENPFVLVPILVVQPYYADRAPYPMISEMLRKAGAQTDLSVLRAHWLESCTNPDPDLRAKVAASDGLRDVLMQGAAEVSREKCREGVREMAAPMEEVFGGENMTPKRRQELDQIIAANLAECDT